MSAVLTREETLVRCAALGWTQNELARRIRRDSGFVSKVLHGHITSSIVLAQIARVLAREEAKRERATT